MTQLAALSLPRPPEVQLPELELPPWRTLRSNNPDPVTQVAPGHHDLSGRNAGEAPDAAATGFNFDGIAGFLGAGYEWVSR